MSKGLSYSQYSKPEYNRDAGFTLIELMVVIVIVGILAAVAIPSYSNYIRKSHAKAAAADLVAISLVMENAYQRQLSYTAGTTTSTAATITYLTGTATASPWQAAESNFTYTIVATTSTYTLTATAISTTTNSGCVLTLNNTNARTSNSNSGCGGFNSW